MTTVKTEIKSVEGKEPNMSQVNAMKPAIKGSMHSEMQKDVIPISVDAKDSQSTAQLQLNSSMCDDREDSFCEKNSIAEFEMLEKECFQDETAPAQDL